MVEKFLKSPAPPNVTFVAKGNKLKGNMPYSGKKTKNGPCPHQNSHFKGGIAKNHFEMNKRILNV